MRRRLRALLGPGGLRLATEDCLPYGYDNSKRQGQPGAVVFPEHPEQVAAILQVCNEFIVPLIPRGRGTGTTGAVTPLAREIVLSCERLNRILEIDPANRLARVQPGVTNLALQQALAPHRLFWPPDPTSAAVCTLGGNLAYNAAGPRAVKYGTPRDNTLGLVAVSGGGQVLRTGTRTTKGVVGYDLTRLLIGSEGTLGVITEATLKLTPLPEATRTLQARFRDIAAATEAIVAIMGQAVAPCALELMDSASLDLVRRFSAHDIDPAVGAILMVEVDGPAACIEHAVAAVGSACAVPGRLSIAAAEDAEAVAALWRIRRSLSPALRHAAPKKINEDVVVPVAALPRLIAGLQSLSRETGIRIVNFGHAGNGNLHVNMLYDPAVPGESERAEHCMRELFHLVLGLGGTLSGEHGVGLAKREAVEQELDPQALTLMRGIKRVFDPQGILNPNKTLPLLSP